MFRSGAVAVAAVGALALTGCGAEESGGAGPGSTLASAAQDSRAAAPEPTVTSGADSSGAAAPEATAGATTPAPSPTPTPDPAQTLVSLSISGGFAGVSRQVVLRGDGTVHARDNGTSATRHLRAAEFTRLRTLLGDPALGEVPDLTVNTGAADLFQYRLRFDGRTLTTDRSAAHPALDRLIDALSAFLPKG
ncbi:hypothetical protein SAMN06272735_0948 [Streptomyces sp. TLI_55]|uniref:hypothetical protein n=1 Tax=Streptomyces sp. TLI_55 TaxID=1938861 RepID=UPI000BC37350|nr:hypothetical protein [Streptomyces sp. TLI_55]SNX56497.1 hypothetical protein SAMN06272735_0948 [Streptomyces sp. TLI_55]